MIANAIKKNWQIIALNILLLIIFVLGYGRFGDVIVDSFREAYIPEQVLRGHVLYKNIFTIYTPFSYLLNALLYKVFGLNLNTLYLAGFFTTAGIINIVFFISKKFFPKTYSFIITLFIISTGVLSTNVFNYFFPYSYGILYGLFFVLLSIYFVLNKKYTLAYIMYSFAICSKFEYLFLLPVLFYADTDKNIPKILIALASPVILIYGILFLQGMSFENLYLSTELLLTISATKTLYWFYSISGLVFRIELIPIYLINFFKLLFPIITLYYLRKWWLYLLFIPYFYYLINQEFLIFAFPLILILFVTQFKHLNKNKIIYVLASLALSAKIFFAMTLGSYGVFFLPFVLVSLFILTPRKFKKYLFIVFLICSLTFGIKNIKSLQKKNTIIQSEKGFIYTSERYGNSINKLISFINEKTSKNDRILIYPECLIANYFTNRNSDNKFYSLIPLYVETFGEEIIIKRIEQTKPEYIIISNYDTSNYYYSYFGQDYAGDIFEYLQNKYENIQNIGNNFTFFVFKRK